MADLRSFFIKILLNKIFFVFTDDMMQILQRTTRSSSFLNTTATSGCLSGQRPTEDSFPARLKIGDLRQKIGFPRKPGNAVPGFYNYPQPEYLSPDFLITIDNTSLLYGIVILDELPILDIH